ncbi:proline-rich protein DC2.15 [Sesamum alatum]|uniref:Proline-rich protein DC2.15 n=1 Tax=Sesamum alatum TaxID=300844 RepID=A0AAE2CKG5_9LAMI|nr:proline-rich protein DC2.15 [Sesamum alatum]
MASSSRNSTILLFLFLNLLYFSLVSCNTLVVQPPTSTRTCSKDTLNLRACADLLQSLISTPPGKAPTEQCCGLIQGLTDLDAAVCLCTDIKAGLLGKIPIDYDIAIGILLSACWKDVASGFHCA